MQPTISQIQYAICNVFDCTRKELLGDGRSPGLVDARWVMFFLARKLAGRSSAFIAKATGFDRASVGYALRNFEARMAARHGLSVGLMMVLSELEGWHEGTWQQYGCYTAEVRI